MTFGRAPRAKEFSPRRRRHEKWRHGGRSTLRGRGQSGPRAWVANCSAGDALPRSVRRGACLILFTLWRLCAIQAGLRWAS